MAGTRRKPRRRWLWITTASVAVTMVLCGFGAIGLFLYAHDGDEPQARPAPTPVIGPATTSDQAPRAAPAGAVCDYMPTSQPPGEPRLAPTPEALATHAGSVRATIRTNLGDLTVELDATAAPCTVHSFVHLARSDYYTETTCHRLVTEGIFILQCGDPEGTGYGSPGYRFAEENLPTGVMPAYPRGTLAMANAGQGTTGAQFFVVYRDSDIPPDYTVFGQVTAGVEVIEKAAGDGTESGESDGQPRTAVDITEITFA